MNHRLISSEARADDTPLDLPTIVAAAIVAYVVANVLHEGLGHGGACLLFGCRPRVLTTAYFDGDSSNISDTGLRLIAAGGTLVNLTAGVFFLSLLRSAKNARGVIRYFLWISMTVNLLVGTGYPLFSGVLGVGDWVKVVDGWESTGLWRLALSILGIVLYMSALWLSLRELAKLAGDDQPGSRRRAVRFTLIPYLLGSVASTLGAFLNPIGLVLVATSAAAHFGGTSGLAWMAQMLPNKWFPPVKNNPLRIPRSWGWVALAAILLAGHVVFLGPGIRF